MSTRARIIVISILLLLAVGSTVLAATSTVQAFHAFQRQRTLVKIGDVSTVRSWMTVPYIARVYHVPQSSVYSALHLVKKPDSSHMTLSEVAQHSHQPIAKIIQIVQHSILEYRRQHPMSSHTPTPTRTIHARHSVPEQPMLMEGSNI